MPHYKMKTWEKFVLQGINESLVKVLPSIFKFMIKEHWLWVSKEASRLHFIFLWKRKPIRSRWGIAIWLLAPGFEGKDFVVEFVIHIDYSVSNQVSNQCKASGISLKVHLCNFLPLKMVYKISSANVFFCKFFFCGVLHCGIFWEQCGRRSIVMP